MLEILQISHNGLKANQDWLNSISHNVANMQTPGFKKTSVNFGELIANRPSTTDQSLAPQLNGMGVSITNLTTDFSKGDMKSTGRALDIAIDGNGFIELQLENGDLAYTRLGHLSVSNEGRLVANDGTNLSADILIPPGVKNIKIDQNGVVSAQMDQQNYIEVGTINIVEFSNPESLQPMGNEIYIATKSSGDPEHISVSNNNSVGILQGFLEMSNVNLIDEMSNLLVAQRAYQLNARLMQTADQILETINNLRR